LEIPRRSRVSKAKIFKGKDKAKMIFLEGWEHSNQETL